MSYRVLVTGSRAWTHHDLIRLQLDLREKIHGGILVVDGDCPTGADATAKAWCAARPDRPREPHPADWEAHKPIPGSDRKNPAGFIRNQAMVDAGADECLAFIADGSAGASHCADRAEAAGIPTTRFTINTATGKRGARQTNYPAGDGVRERPEQSGTPTGLVLGLEGAACPERATLPELPGPRYDNEMCMRCGRVTPRRDDDGHPWCGGSVPAAATP